MQRLTHVALSVPRELFSGEPRTELLAFYLDVFGWSENEALARPGQRIVLRAPSDRQYLTLHASDDPMTVSGAEHFGVAVGTEAELHEIHERARAFSARAGDVSLGPIARSHGDALTSFRVRFRLPLAVEVQWFRESQGGRDSQSRREPASRSQRPS